MIDYDDFSTVERSTGRDLIIVEEPDGYCFVQYRDTGSIVYGGTYREAVDYMGIANEYD